MAERRMFAQKIITSDRFLDLPFSAQALYFQLSMQADDDGLVDGTKKILRMAGAADSDLRALEAAGLVLVFESGVAAIRHWRVNNRIQRDRYKPSLCVREVAQLRLDPAGAYEIVPETPCVQNGSKLDTQDREGEVSPVQASSVQSSVGEASPVEASPVQASAAQAREGDFAPPTLQEVAAYCQERNNQVDPGRFVDFYASKGWKVGQSPMRDWKAALRRWESSPRRDPVAPPPSRAAPGMAFAASSIDSQMRAFLAGPPAPPR